MPLLSTLILTFGAPLAFLHFAASLTEYRVSTRIVALGILGGMLTVGIMLQLAPWLSAAAEGLEGGGIAALLLDALYLTAGPEEALKLLAMLALIRLCQLRRLADHAMVGASVGTGFAALESLLFVTAAPGGEPALITALFRGLTAVPLHALCGLLAGAVLHLGRHRSGPRPAQILTALMLTTALHGAYGTVLRLPALLEVPQRMAAMLLFAGLTLVLLGLLLVSLQVLALARRQSGARDGLALQRRRSSDSRSFAGGHCLLGFSLIALAALIGMDGLSLLRPLRGDAGAEAMLASAALVAVLFGAAFLDEARRWLRPIPVQIGRNRAAR